MMSRRRTNNPYLTSAAITTTITSPKQNKMMSINHSASSTDDTLSASVIDTSVPQQLPPTPNMTAAAAPTVSSSSSLISAASAAAAPSQQPPSYEVTKSLTDWLTQCKAENVRSYVYSLSLHRTLIDEKLLDVPFPSMAVMRQIDDWMNPQQRRAAAKMAPETTLFFGCLPRNCPKQQLVALMMLLCNVVPIDIRVHAGSNGRNAGCAHVVVRAGDANKVIAGLHKRVLFDEACWIYAQDERAIQVMHKYCTMLESDETVRFQSRPYTSLVVMPGSQHVHQQHSHHSAAAAAASSSSSHTAFQQQQQQQQQVQAPRCCFSDLYHPMCTSPACIQFREQNTDVSVLHGIYLEYFAADVDFGDCIPVHSMPPQDEYEASRWKTVTHSHLSNANKRAATAWSAILANKRTYAFTTPRHCSQHCPTHQQQQQQQQHQQAQC